MTLDTLKPSIPAQIKLVKQGALASKLIEMGLYPGKRVTLLYRAPFGDPIAIDVEGYTLSLRRAESSLVELEQ